MSKVLRAPDDITVVRSTEVGNVEFVNGIAEEFTDEQAEYLAVLGFSVVDSESLESEEESASTETENVPEPDAPEEDLRTPAEEEEEEDTREEESDPVEPRADEEVNDFEEDSGEEDAAEEGELEDEDGESEPVGEEDADTEPEPSEVDGEEEESDGEGDTGGEEEDEDRESEPDEPVNLPTMRDNVATITQFAQDNNISLEGADTKREMLSIIGEQLN